MMLAPTNTGNSEQVDRARQALQRLDVELILTAEIDQHLSARDAVDAAVVGLLLS